MVLCGLNREASVGTWWWVISGPPLSVELLFFFPFFHCPHPERGGAPALSAKPVREGDIPLCFPSGPLALLQENSAVFQGRLRPRLKRLKEFGRLRET